MAVSVEQFWRLAVESQLLSPARRDELCAEFARRQARPGGQPTAQQLASWLVSRQEITSYQSTILLAGRPGPFVYADYRIHERIDRGRLAGWFRAVHVPTGHPVLLEFASGPLLKDPGAWAAAVRRAQELAPITDERLLRLHDAVDIGAFKFFVRENPRGAPLSDTLAEGDRLPFAEACRLARDAARALAALHQQGRAHGDLRLENMLRGADGGCQLLVDVAWPWIGMSQRPGESPAAWAERADYFAPELARSADAPAGELSPAPLVDLYALGCALYRLLTGRPPFPGDDALAKMQQHAKERIEPLEPLGVPAELARTIAFLMAKKTSLRTASAVEAAEQLAAWAQPSAPRPKALPSWSHYEAWLRGRQFAPPRQPERPPAPRTAPAPVAFPSPATVPSPVTAAPPVFPSPPAVFPSPPAPKLSEVVIDPGRVPAAAPSIVAASAGRSKSRRQRQQMVVYAVSAIAMAVTGVLLVTTLSGNDPPDKDRPGNDKQTASSEAAASAEGGSPDRQAAVGDSQAGSRTAGDRQGKGATTKNGKPPAGGQVVVEDDGSRLWASPTAGETIERQLAAPGAQVLIYLRPKRLLADEEGARAVQALGPAFAAHRSAWEAAAGVGWQELESLTITFHANGEAPPRLAFTAELAAPVAKTELVAKWGNPSRVAGDDGEYLQKNDWCYYTPDGESVRVFAMGAQEEIAAVAAGEAAPMRREVEQLMRRTDRDRHLTAVFAPNFFFADGRKLFQGEYAKLLPPLSWFLGDGLKAGSISAHLSDHLYLELRLVADVEIDEYTLSTQLGQRLAETPDRIENYIAAVDPPAYWKKVALRYPRMMHLLQQQTRVGAENDQAVLNAVLPKVATHNLLAASEVVLATAPGAAVQTAAAEPAGPRTIDEVLSSKINLSFPAQSLEFAMQDVATAVGEAWPQLPFPFVVKVLGADLEKDGITRNQTVRDLDQRDKTVAQVLTAMVMKANPITTVKSPDEANQKLIWVVADNPDMPGTKAVLITTRDAAASKGYTLPAVFQTKGS